MLNKNTSSILILWLFVAVLIAYHSFAYIGHYGYDDLHYARLATNLLKGQIDYNDHFTYRIPVVLFTAFAYAVFGISDFASSLSPMIFSILAILLVYLILRREGNIRVFTGLAFATISNWFLFYSDKLMPDIYVEFSFVLSLFIIYYYKFRKSEKPFIFGALLALALFFGFISKGTIVLIIPLLLCYIIVDIYNKRDYRFWMYSFLSGVVILAVYMFFSWYLTGDVFKRFGAIGGNSYLNLCSYDKQSIGVLLKRIFYDFFYMMINQAMILGFIFLIPYLFSKRFRAILSMDNPTDFFAISATILLLSSNFMSISVTSYIPMCIDPRHYLFLVPVVSIPASYVIEKFIDQKQYGRGLVAITLGVLVFSFMTRNDTFGKLYLPLFTLFFVYYLLPSTSLNKRIFLLLFVFVLSIKPFDMVIYAAKVQYVRQKEIVLNEFINDDKSCYVITSDVQKRLGDYYGGFDEHLNCKFLSYNKFKADTLDDVPKYLMRSWYTEYLSFLNDDDLPYYARNIGENHQLIFEDKDLNLAIYRLNKIEIPQETGENILSSFNGFEEPLQYWNQQESDITSGIFFKGSKSSKVDEYSSSFEYSLDSLSDEDCSQLVIYANAYFWVESETTASLVVSIENKDGTYFWKGLDINKYIHAYSNWWPVKMEISLPSSEIKDDSKIKVYLWNKNKETVYLDDFSVDLYQLR